MRAIALLYEQISHVRADSMPISKRLMLFLLNLANFKVVRKKVTEMPWWSERTKKKKLRTWASFHLTEMVACLHRVQHKLVNILIYAIDCIKRAKMAGHARSRLHVKFAEEVIMSGTHTISLYSVCFRLDRRFNLPSSAQSYWFTFNRWTRR